MNTRLMESDRVVSFSYKPQDKDSYEAITKLKKYGKVRGISFSFLIINAIKNYLEELENE